jgi:hypothetical protein
MNQWTQGYCLTKITRGRKSRAYCLGTLPLPVPVPLRNACTTYAVTDTGILCVNRFLIDNHQSGLVILGVIYNFPLLLLSTCFS